MEWCLSCHRDPGKNLRPTSQIYNMAWSGVSSDKPVWCATTGKTGPTAQAVDCTPDDPNLSDNKLKLASYNPGSAPGTPASTPGMPVSEESPYQKFTSQAELGKFLTVQYHIRTPQELTSCEVCHR
jgi:hypothetical protein